VSEVSAIFHDIVDKHLEAAGVKMRRVDVDMMILAIASKMEGQIDKLADKRAVERGNEYATRAMMAEEQRDRMHGRLTTTAALYTAANDRANGLAHEVLVLRATIKNVTSILEAAVTPAGWSEPAGVSGA
jgi:hypothetical protein